MVSSNEVGFDLREKKPPPPVGRYQATTLCSQTAYGGRRTNPKQDSCLGLPKLVLPLYQHQGPDRTPDYPIGVRDSAASGLGRFDNHHLNGLAESAVVNVRGSRETDWPAVGQRNLGSVGAAIVLRGRESRLPGEGRQFVGIA